MRRFAAFAIFGVMPFAVALAACSGADGADTPGGDGDGGGDGGEDGLLDGGDAGAGGDAGDSLVVDGPAACAVNGVAGECVDITLCTGELMSTPGLCPGGAGIECCTLRSAHGDATVDARADAPDGSAGWCPTDPGARPNEGLREEPGDPGCPSGMIHISTFCVDRFEASVVIVAKDGSERSWSPYYPPRSTDTYRAVSLRGAVPQGYISGEESQRACKASGKRLCVNTEWLRACRGPSDFIYPYGNTREPGVCNDGRAEHPAIQCFGTSASWIWSELGWPGIDQQAATVDRTGARTGCVTTEGAFDMMGNLHEWIYDDPSKYTPPARAIDFRGGYYADTKLNGPGCLYQTTAHTFSHWDYSTGFRCCADAL